MEETPLLAIRQKNGQSDKRQTDGLIVPRLTADCFGLPERLGHLGVHLDVLVLLLDDCQVPVVTAGLHPLGELALQDRRADVDEPLLRHLRQLDVRLGQVLVDMGCFFIEELPDVFDGEAFVSERKERHE